MPRKTAHRLGLRSAEFDWWQRDPLGDVAIAFLPTQHSSGPSLIGPNRTLCGGGFVAHRDRRFYYAGDSAFVEKLFPDIRAGTGPSDLAALPVGAHRPRTWLRRGHTAPVEDLRAQRLFGALRTFGVHWETFQLGDGEPSQPAKDLDAPRYAAPPISGCSPSAAVSMSRPNCRGCATTSAREPSFRSRSLVTRHSPPPTTPATAGTPPPA